MISWFAILPCKRLGWSGISGRRRISTSERALTDIAPLNHKDHRLGDIGGVVADLLVNQIPHREHLLPQPGEMCVVTPVRMQGKRAVHVQNVYAPRAAADATAPAARGACALPGRGPLRRHAIGAIRRGERCRLQSRNLRARAR